MTTYARILVTGGTGFIGRPLCRSLLAKGYQVTVLSRQPRDVVTSLCGEVDVIHSLLELAPNAPLTGVINLAGAGIADQRWSPARKDELLNSRIALTRDLVSSLARQPTKPKVLVSGSAVGFYGAWNDEILDERSPPHDEFTHQLCSAWEEAALSAKTHGIRVCLARTGLVIGANGGFLKRMLLPFRLGLGGPLGQGNQYMSWIHREDEVNALIWLLEHDDTAGAYNLTAPAPVTNAAFTRALARQLKRPAVLPAPAPILRLLLGEMSRLLLTGQRVLPVRLLESGFRFAHPELDAALKDVIHLH